MNSWYSPLSSIASLGSRHKWAGSLAGLHEDRKVHLGQFFTPDDVVRVAWDLVRPAMDGLRRRFPDRKVTLLDNSFGSGRMFQFADPAVHFLAGCEVHAATVKQVTEVVGAAGFHCDLVTGAMEEARLSRYDVALINPPFSLNLESPNMEAMDVCSYGRFGPQTSCLSHVFALAQALAHAQIVVAVLPWRFASELPKHEHFSQRLRALVRLPSGAFDSEGAGLDTGIAVFDSIPSKDCMTCALKDLPTAVDLGLYLPKRNFPVSPIVMHGIDSEEPYTKDPVTGNREVRLVKQGRKIGFRFQCALMKVKAMNAVLESRLGSTSDLPKGARRPACLTYTGDGRLDLHTYLIQDDPLAALDQTLDRIRAVGGVPSVAPEITGYLRRQHRKLQRHRVPLAHTIRLQKPDGATEWAARHVFALEPNSWSSPIIKAGERFKPTPKGERWEITIKGKAYAFTQDEATKHFSIVGGGCIDWAEKFTGRLKAFPQAHQGVAARARRLGLDRFLSYGYQFADLCELAISPYGAIGAWVMGTGKSRLGAGLSLFFGGKHNLYVTEPHLVEEVAEEFRNIGLPAGEWQVLDSAKKLNSLRRVNIITYNRLRLALAPGSKRTYAHSLRHRISTLICDEGHHLRNPDSDRSRALWQVAAVHRFILTGTPIASYPRDVFHLMRFLGGDGTAANPYGFRNGMLELWFLNSVHHARRGMDVFVDDFVTMEWATHEFRDTLTEGAKREVPKIGNLAKYRDTLSRWVKRRILEEPAVAAHISIPRPVKQTHVLEFDPPHRALYLKVAQDFVKWFKDERARAGEERRNLNLIALLARIGAIEQATNHPAKGVQSFGSYAKPNSKDRAILSRAEELIKDGRKVIIFADSPGVLERLSQQAAGMGVDSVLVHGGLDIAQRTEELRTKFRRGPVPLLLASLGCAQTGLNIPESSAVLFYNRDWRAIVEQQALGRTLRPQQKGKVLCEFFHLRGSIDEYKAQMVAMKADAADAGMDWATPELSDQEFLHLDHIIARFVRDLEEEEKAHVA